MPFSLFSEVEGLSKQLAAFTATRFISGSSESRLAHYVAVRPNKTAEECLPNVEAPREGRNEFLDVGLHPKLILAPLNVTLLRLYL